MAGRVIEVTSIYEKVHTYCEAYATDEPADFSVIITQEDIDFEYQRELLCAEHEGRKPLNTSEEYREELAVYRKIAEKMPDYETILFHGSVIAVDGRGYLFTAKSGTGKSTQRRLWEKYSSAKVINDDKNFITLKDDKLYISPNPWCGKHFKQNNINSTLNVIIFLYQNKINEINILPKAKAFRLLLGQILQPSNDNIDKWNKIVDKLLELPIYHFGCNMEEEAFKLLNERILKDVK